jgi:lipid-A-disaccharide synthase-like uncharacterized protein
MMTNNSISIFAIDFIGLKCPKKRLLLQNCLSTKTSDTQIHKIFWWAKVLGPQIQQIFQLSAIL